MENGRENKNYKSPSRKLINFFERSRDQWKAKCSKAKKTVKRLTNRIRFLEKSKERWKMKAKELEDEIARIKAKERAKEKEVEKVKKNG